MPASHPLRARCGAPRFSLSRGALVLLSLLTVAMISACGKTETGGGATTKLVVVTGPPLGSPAVAFAWIGARLGYYKDEGVDVEFQSTLGDAERALASVVGGQGDVLYYGLDTVLNAVASGKDVQLQNIYSVYTEGLYVQAVTNTSSVRSMADLKGKTIGVPQTGPTYERYVSKALEENGLTLKDVKLLATGVGPAMGESLQRGEVDAVVGTLGQIIPLITQGYNMRELPRPDVEKQLTGANIMVPKNLSAEKKKALAGFLRAFSKSIVFAKANPKAAVELAWKTHPEAKPKTPDQDKALRDAVFLLERSLSIMSRVDGKWGLTPPAKVVGLVEYLGVKDKIPNVQSYNTNEYIDSANAFDEAAVTKRAKEYTGG